MDPTKPILGTFISLFQTFMETMIVEKLHIHPNNNAAQRKTNPPVIQEDLLTSHTLNSNKTIKNYSPHIIKKHNN